LVVDDEKNMRMTLEDILLDEGYTVGTAENGEAAIERLAEDHYDVVLLDVRMPGMGGLETLRRIRRHDDTARIIMMSAYSADPLKRSALQEGAVAFLSKPLDIPQVLRLIEEGDRRAVLIVGAEPEGQARVIEIMKTRGYRVVWAQSVHEAIEVVEQIRFDLIVLDERLSEPSSSDLVQAIRQIAPSTHVVTLESQAEDRVERQDVVG
jgi:CheY-like chemotaxis protein